MYRADDDAVGPVILYSIDGFKTNNNGTADFADFLGYIVICRKNAKLYTGNEVPLSPIHFAE